jgi:membrane fusion protein (multidrug efflux system)
MLRLRRRIIRFFLLGVVPLAVLVAGADYWVKNSRYITTENAYIKAHHLTVSADIDGRTIRVLVRENDRVKAGALLFELDPEPHRIMLARAEAELGGVRNTIAALRAEYREAKAEIAVARQDIAYFQRIFGRQEKLSARGVATRARFDEAERNLTRARQQARTLNQKMQQVLARLGGKLNAPVESHPLYMEVQARRNQAALNLRRTRVVAPAAGIVGPLNLQPGEFVETGKAMIPIIQAGEIWVEANLKETQLTHVGMGQKAELVIDAYPDRTWTATVRSISPSTGAEFSVLPPQNASGNWVKVVQRVPVRLEVDRRDGEPPLRAGMTVNVRIDTKRERTLAGIIRSAFAGARK